MITIPSQFLSEQKNSIFVLFEHNYLPFGMAVHLYAGTTVHPILDHAFLESKDNFK